jgi:uncharacterized protein (TIGR02118 family)
MAKLLVIYGKPADPAAFDRYYFDTHVPLAKEIPGLRAYDVNRGAVMTPAGPADAHLVAMLTFDDMAAIQVAFASEEGRRAAADLDNFATGGAQMLMFETRSLQPWRR